MGRLLEAENQAIRFQFGLDNGEQPSVTVRKGRNRNILVKVESAAAAKELASLENPFSIFSPGLAGVSKAEQFVSDGVLLRTIARGDANLVLRNILLRLWRQPDQWQAFLTDLRDLFPEIAFRVDFEESTDEFISVFAKIQGHETPLELAGTGVLQATQILAYIHRFSPSLIVLDEPDSHLHPNNQRLLCALLNRVSEEREVQVILTTHSRHVVDAIGRKTQFLWVRNGTVNVASEDDEIGILLEIGALDIRERVGNPNTSVVYLTEDENARPSTALLTASGFDLDRTVILPYFGVTSIKNLRPLVNTIRASNPNVKIVLHRDRDYLTDEEVNEWETNVRKINVDPFVTLGVDIESHFIDASHLSSLNPEVSQDQFEDLIDEIVKDLEPDSITHYVNGRIDVERAKGRQAQINHGQLAVEAAKEVQKFPRRFLHGKTAIRTLRRKFQEKYGSNLRDIIASPIINNQSLALIAKKTFGTSFASK